MELWIHMGKKRKKGKKSKRNMYIKKGELGEQTGLSIGFEWLRGKLKEMEEDREWDGLLEMILSKKTSINIFRKL